MNVKGSSSSEKSMKILKAAQNEVEEMKVLLQLNSKYLATSNNKVNTLTKVVEYHQTTAALKNEELKSLNERFEKYNAGLETN